MMRNEYLLFDYFEENIFEEILKNIELCQSQKFYYWRRNERIK